MRYAATASSWIKAPQPTVLSILRGYREYEAWLPEVTRSRLLAREGGVAITELIAPAWGSEKILLEMVESPDSIAFTQIDRYREKGMTGRWRLTPTERGEGVVVHAELALRHSLFSLRCRQRIRAVLERSLSALGDRAFQALATGRSGTPSNRRKILEAVRSADRLVVTLGDDVFDLERHPGSGEA